MTSNWDIVIYEIQTQLVSESKHEHIHIRDRKESRLNPVETLKPFHTLNPDVYPGPKYGTRSQRDKEYVWQLCGITGAYTQLMHAKAEVKKLEKADAKGERDSFNFSNPSTISRQCRHIYRVLKVHLVNESEVV